MFLAWRIQRLTKHQAESRELRILPKLLRVCLATVFRVAIERIYS
jgi:hypothetical protein